MSMRKRLFLIDSDSLYTTSMSAYRGRVDFVYLMQRMKEVSSGDECKFVVFHGEPSRGGSLPFQEFLRGEGYKVVVIPTRFIPNTKTNARSVPVHLSAYLMQHAGEYQAFDFISGDVNYSPLSTILLARGAEVTLWLFSGRIPVFRNDEDPYTTIRTMNESFMMESSGVSHTLTLEHLGTQVDEAISQEHRGAGVVGITSDTPTRPSTPKPEASSRNKEAERAFREARNRGARTSASIDLGVLSAKGCEDV